MEDPSDTPAADATLYAIAPGPPATTDEENARHEANIPQVGELSALVYMTPTVHNWMQLVYGAFGHELPTGPNDVALLGLRGASLAAPAQKDASGKVVKKAAPATTPAEITRLEEGVEGGNVEMTHAVPALSTSTYGDLLFLAHSQQSLNQKQLVDAFECIISVTPLNGPARLPDLLEGKQFFAHTASYFGPRAAAHDILEVDVGVDKKQRAVDAARAEHASWTSADGGSKYQDAYPAGDVSWCGMFVSYVMNKARVGAVHYADCWTGRNQFLNGDWGQWISRSGGTQGGDIAFYEFSVGGTFTKYRHTGVVMSDGGAGVTAIEGNTGPPTGSQDNGDGLYLKPSGDRPKSMVSGFCRPRYKPIIRWGTEGMSVKVTSPSGETILRHHYYKGDPKAIMCPSTVEIEDTAKWETATVQVDGDTRYARFFKAAKSAANAKAIPYLIVSTKYVLTYSEWCKYVTKMGGALMGFKPPVSSVLRAEGLKPKGGIHGRYLPSFLSEDDVKQKKAHINAIYNKAPAGETPAARAKRIEERDAVLKQINDTLIEPAELPGQPPVKA